MKMTQHADRLIVAMLAVMMVMIMIAPAATFAADTKDELKARFKQRDPELSKLKDQGKVGENWQGFVEPVKEDAKLDADARKLIEDENSDRRKLYALIASDAKHLEKKITAADVGEQNGLRNFSKSKPQEYLKTKEGRWIQRREVDQLKHEGKIGETWEGYLGAVQVKYADDPQIHAVLTTENSIREEMYAKRLRSEDRSEDRSKIDAAAIAKEAQRAGKENLDRAKSGEFIKDKDGKWSKK